MTRSTHPGNRTNPSLPRFNKTSHVESRYSSTCICAILATPWKLYVTSKGLMLYRSQAIQQYGHVHETLLQEATDRHERIDRVLCEWDKRRVCGFQSFKIVRDCTVHAPTQLAGRKVYGMETKAPRELITWVRRAVGTQFWFYCLKTKPDATQNF